MHAFDRQTDEQTDGQTDGQTDRNLIVKTALHSMQRGKNQEIIRNFDNSELCLDYSGFLDKIKSIKVLFSA